MRFRYKEKRKGHISSIKDIFEDFISEYNLTDSFSFESLVMEWKDITGPILSVHSKPLKIENDILYIVSDHPVFSNDIIMMKGTIKEKMRTLFGQEIKDIRIVKKNTQ